MEVKTLFHLFLGMGMNKYNVKKQYLQQCYACEDCSDCTKTWLQLC